MKKRDNIIYWVATLWLSLGMVSTGLGQLMKMKAAEGGVDTMIRLGFPLYFLIIVGVWKFLGVIAVLIPKFPILKEWAYAGFFFVMTGAIWSRIASGDGVIELLPAVLLLVLTFLSRYFRPADRKVMLLTGTEK